jgi:nickel/cobalt exporter
VRYLFLALLLFALPSLTLAQSGGGPFAPQSAKKAEAQTTDSAAEADEPGFFSRMIAAIITEQRQFHRRLAAALGDIREKGAAAAAWTLIVTSFLYGVFHAAGPGHGKAILTAYLATHRQRMLRAILLSAAAAAVQGIVAIALVFGLTFLAGWAARDTQSAVRWAEQFSFALVALLGAYLVYRAIQSLRRLIFRPAAAPLSHHHATGNDGHNHDHAHCGHAHMPTPDQMAEAHDLKTMLGVVFSIGIRPCSGAVLVLAVANVFGIQWSGIAAVFAMSLGTAIAVATLALVVLSARHLVTRIVASDGPGFAVAGHCVALAGGAIIVVLGVTLFLGSIGPSHPLGL